ncbi:hypothetical protein FB451DRAFT_716209 [Mycena latifolia]|nr:hypothetical protein FB451DRAFT_716209 [Mycena latifolia]
MDLARSILKTLSSAVLCATAAWDISSHWIGFFASSIPPSAELLPLIRQINPVFILVTTTSLEQIINWFKEIRPVPADLQLVAELRARPNFFFL